MIFSYNWLQSFFSRKLPKPEKLAEILTMHSFEVENIIYQGEGLEGVVVGEILGIQKHPNADRLNIAKVDAGGKKARQIIFGQMAKMEIGFKIPVALAPTVLPGGKKIEKTKLRGELSEGMLCLDQELGIFKKGVSITFFDKNVKNGTSIKKALGLDDVIFDIDILPNRAGDCLSHLGVARECAVLAKSNIKNPRFKVIEDKKLRTKDFISVEVQDKDACLRYTARVITNVKVGPSPEWIQERLKVCGLRPINNIVDITNYVMLETGQPLHAFDYQKISNLKSQISKPQLKIHNLKKIIIRRAKKGEKITTLDDEKYDLDEGILVIADSKEPLAIAGIKGGKKAEIDENAKTIILESANFELRGIRRASRKLNLRTDASLRFEHGIDPNLTELAINRVSFLIREIAKGKIVKSLVDVYPKKVLPKKIRLDLNYAESLLGVKISPREITKIFRALGFKIKKSPACPVGSHRLSFGVASRQFLIEVPTFRLDVSLPEDLIEEIGRVYDYQNIPSKMPLLPFSPPKENRDILWARKIKGILKGFGFNETSLYSFISEKDAQLFLSPPDPAFAAKNILRREAKFISRLIEIENPTSIDAKYLRPSLLPSLLKAVNKNQETYKEIELFEIGKTYRKKLKVKSEKLKVEESNVKNKFQKQQDILEKKVLAGVVVGEDKFYELKGCIEALFESLGVVEVFFDSFKQVPKETPFVFWEKENSAEIRQKTGDIEIGFIGKIRQEVSDFYFVKKPVFAFEIDFEKLLQLVEEEHEYEMPSPYPETFRDLSVLIPLNALAGEVIRAINFFGGEVLRDVEVIDIYEGDPLPEGKKNLTFTLIFQSKEKTLSSEEIDKIMEKIVKGIEENIDWEVRR